jgi:hypothetical protein
VHREGRIGSGWSGDEEHRFDSWVTAGDGNYLHRQLYDARRQAGKMSRPTP